MGVRLGTLLCLSYSFENRSCRSLSQVGEGGRKAARGSDRVVRLSHQLAQGRLQGLPLLAVWCQHWAEPGWGPMLEVADDSVENKPPESVSC